MRKFFYLMMMAMAICTVSLTSCSSNDDGGNGGGGATSIKVGNADVNFGYVYWNIDPDAGTSSQKYYQLEFWSWDFYNTGAASNMSTFILGFRSAGSDSELPTGTFSNYDLSGAINFSQSNPEGTYIEGDRNNSGSLKITKEGNTYTVSIEPLYILSGNGDNPSTSTKTTLLYTGSLPKAPRNSWE